MGTVASATSGYLNSGGVLQERGYPLREALFQNKPGEIKRLLEAGADPEVKDEQNLSAIDHAVLVGNQQILALFVGHKIQKDHASILSDLQAGAGSKIVAQLVQTLDRMKAIDLTKLDPIYRAAYEGNLEELKRYPSLVNDSDKKGMTPLQYAILGNRPDAVKELLKMGANAAVVDKNKDSIAHYIAMSGSRELLSLFPKLKYDQPNSQGQTPLHYAAACQNLELFQAMTVDTTPRGYLDNQGLSPLAYFGGASNQKDPLKLSKLQLALFTMTMAYALIQYGVITNIDSLFPSWFVPSQMIPIHIPELALVLTTIQGMGTSAAEKVGSLLFYLNWGTIFPLDLAYKLWIAAGVAHASFDGLKTCLANAANRPLASLRNAVVHTANASGAAINFVKSTILARKTFDLWYGRTSVTYQVSDLMTNWSERSWSEVGSTIWNTGSHGVTEVDNYVRGNWWFGRAFKVDELLSKLDPRNYF
jgi:hypothetical protein